MEEGDTTPRLSAVDITVDEDVLTATIVNPHVEANRGGAIRDAVAAAIDAERDRLRAVILDLAGVDFINSSGLGALVELRNHGRGGLTWILYRPNDDVIGVLRSVHLDRLFPIVTTASGLRNALA